MFNLKAKNLNGERENLLVCIIIMLFYKGLCMTQGGIQDRNFRLPRRTKACTERSECVRFAMTILRS